MKARDRAAGALVLLGIALATKGCLLDATGVDGAPPETCSQPDDCTLDTSPCTSAACVDGYCVHKPDPDGPAPDSVAGDCQAARCVGGEVEVTSDDTDASDGDPCTTDACDAGVATHDPVPVGGACTIGDAAGTCNEQGNCVVECDLTTPCPTSDCFTAQCKNDICKFEYFDVPTTPLDIANDCKQSVCNADHEPTTVADSADLPVADALECTIEECIGDVGMHTPSAVGTPCANGYCDAAGGCVECIIADHCAGGPCNAPQCVDGTCVDMPVQTGNPCLTGSGVCSAAGACVQCIDAALHCAPDTACNDNSCNASGTCVGTPVQTGNPCLIGSGVCSAGGACVECVGDAQCSAPEPKCLVAQNACVACLMAADCVDADTTDCKVPTCTAGHTCMPQNRINGAVCALTQAPPVAGQCCDGACTALGC
ncbi:MAG: hypothetical protein HOW73_18780 [Polyangiaceae bacterium]|nr:hypothetical protein [Polyangiaceae bacterium]